MRNDPRKRFHELGAGRRRHIRLRRRGLGLHLRRYRRVVPGKLDRARRLVRPLERAQQRLDLDPTFSQVQWVGEIERRYDLWGHAGKIAVTGFLTRGRMGSFRERDRAGCGYRRPGQYRRRPPISKPRRRQHEYRAGDHLRSRRFHPRRLGRRQHRAVRIHRCRPHRCRPASRSTASNGAGQTTRSALPASSTEFPACTKPF